MVEKLDNVLFNCLLKFIKLNFVLNTVMGR